MNQIVEEDRRKNKMEDMITKFQSKFIKEFGLLPEVLLIKSKDKAKHRQNLNDLLMLTHNLLISDLCIPYNVRILGIFNKTRCRDIVAYRHAFFVIAHENRHQVSHIGRRVGQNHVTVIRGIKSFKNLLEAGDELCIRIFNRLNDGIKKQFRIISDVQSDNNSGTNS